MNDLDRFKTQTSYLHGRRFKRQYVANIYVRRYISDVFISNDAVFKQIKLSPVAYLVAWLNKFLNGCVIGINAHFDEGFVIMHPNGVIINSKVQGGKNVTLESGVVIGDNRGRSPTLQDNVFVGSGAKIIGEVIIENNVDIGANAVVTKDAPARSVMLGIPAVAKLKDKQ